MHDVRPVTNDAPGPVISGFHRVQGHIPDADAENQFHPERHQPHVTAPVHAGGWPFRVSRSAHPINPGENVPPQTHVGGIPSDVEENPVRRDLAFELDPGHGFHFSV